MKVMIAQINTTPRDFDGNVAQIKDGITRASSENCDLVVFPELSVCGYLTQDLMYQERYIQHNLQALQEVVEFSKGRKQFIVVGYIGYNIKGTGKRFCNLAAVIKNGTIVATHQKQLLPFYDVFDEGRYFEPGNQLTVIEINGDRWGIAICEDVWNDKGMDDYIYSSNPVEAYREIGVTNIIAINSSPFVQQKPAERIQKLKDSFRDGNLIYVNQLGGQDELVFDGHSFVIQNGHVSHLCRTTTEPTFEVAVIQKDYLAEDAINCVFDDIEVLYQMLVLALRDYIRKSGFKEIVVGSSGGIDSAVVIALASAAIGPENVHGIRMPSIYSSDHSKDDALELHENLGCWDYMVPVHHQEFLDNINACFEKGGQDADNLVNRTIKANQYRQVADENIQARLRGKIVMHFSNAYGALPLTTGNKTELALGYCTLYGDMNGGYAVINDLYKMQVYAIARHINERAGGGLS